MVKRNVTLLVMVCLCLLMTDTSVYGEFSFAVTSDQRMFSGPGVYNSSRYFRGAVDAIRKLGDTVFMISPGDIDPTGASKWTIEQVLGANYLWFPVVGNHELPGNGSEMTYSANMDWLRVYNYDANGSNSAPDIVNTGPSGCPQTTYSFDYGNAHFAVLNEYCDVNGDTVTDGDIPDHLYNWLANDLATTRKRHVFVIGHEPAYPQPDADTGRSRHMSDSLNHHPANRNRFWQLLKTTGVTAYICGHTHNYSAVKINGVWQIDSGHARGKGDTGAPSTFLIIRIDGGTVTVRSHRDSHDGVYDYNDIIHRYTLTYEVNTMPWLPLLLP